MGSAEFTNCPSSINREFLERVLGLPPVESFSVKNGTNVGDNFLSVLYTIAVQLKGDDEDGKKELQKLYLLMKVYPSHPARQKFLNDTNCFHKEMMVYKEFVAELTAFQKEVNKSNDEIIKPAFAPFLYGQCIDHSEQGRDDDGSVVEEQQQECEDSFLKNYLVMVDVRETWGFRMANKFKGLDYHHCKLVITELAKLHALCLAYKNRKNLRKLQDKFPYLEEGIFCEKQRASTLEPILNSNTDLVRGILEKSLGKDSPVLKAFSDVQATLMDTFLKYFNSDGLDEKSMEKMLRVQPEEGRGIWDDEQEEEHDSWVVGSHGDCWVNNMLFRYDEKTGTPVACILVDLQLCRESCPTVDLSYFLYTSTETDFRENHLEEMLSIYHSKFLHFCSSLQTKPLPAFTLQNLKRRFHRSKLFGLVAAILVLPIILVEPGKTDLEKSDLPSDGNFSDMLLQQQHDETELTLLSDRLVSVTQEMYNQGVI